MRKQLQNLLALTVNILPLARTACSFVGKFHLDNEKRLPNAKFTKLRYFAWKYEVLYKVSFKRD